MFVRLQDLHIEGLVHITSLGRDFYHFDDVRMCLTGEHSGKKYRVGDEIRVQVAAVNLDEKKIDLRLEGAETESKDKASSRRSTRKKTEAKSTDSSSKQAKSKKGKAKDKSTGKPKEKSKAKKRSARKKRPGKNARKNSKSNA